MAIKSISLRGVPVVFEKIKKRDGSIVAFDSSKITKAIAKAGKATGDFGADEAKKFMLKFYLRDVKQRTGAFWGYHFSTIGIIGMNEACLNFPYKILAF